MSKKTLFTLTVSFVILLAGVGTASAAILTEHSPTLANPADSSLNEVGPYNPIGSMPTITVGCTCHTNYAETVNNNHGLYLRPVLTTVQNASIGDWGVPLPGDANFAAGDVDWVIGGLAIGTERYIFDQDATTSQGAATRYPRIGNKQWFMDNSTTIRPGYPAVADSNRGWQNYTSVNYFTGTNNLTEASTDFGCIRCHAYGAEASVDASGRPTYTVQNWGVTCASCHTAWNKDSGSVTSNHAGAAHNRAVTYSGAVCDMCHQRNPIPAVPEEGVLGRSQQLDQRIWATGHAGRHRDQGYEVNKPEPNPSPDPIPGVTESSDGAGHPTTWQPFMGRLCARCHSTEGYIAHSIEDTDVPYYYDAPWIVGTRRYNVTLPNLHGVTCVACHVSHTTNMGLNDSGNRVRSDVAEGTYEYEYNQCADCHRSQQLSLLAVDTMDDATKVDFNDTRVSHPTREVYDGRAGYGVDNEPALHRLVGVTCKACHMPVTVGQPEADASHLFRIIMPETKMSPVMQTNITPVGVVTTTTATIPDDSCTGFGCHLETNDTRQFLQDVITARQGAILNKFDAVKSKLDSMQAEFGANETWKKARTNLLIVQNDGSWGVHNYYYSRDLLNYADLALDNLMAAGGPTAIPVDRYAGADRYQTALQISRETFTDGSASDAVLASGLSFADALAASGLAGAVDGPVLLTTPGSLPSGLITELNRLGVNTVHIAGGTSAVSASVSTALTNAGFGVLRYAGANRYDTAALVADQVATVTGVGFGKKAFVVRGDEFADALAVGPLAYNMAYPVLLVGQTTLPTETRAALLDLDIEEVVIAGGTGAVSSGVASAIQALPTSPVVVRRAGANRYETATNVATYGVGRGWATYSFVGVSSGVSFPDALGGGAATGANAGVMVLTAPTALPTTTRSFLQTHSAAGHIDQVVIFGGVNAISDTVRVQVYDAVN